MLTKSAVLGASMLPPVVSTALLWGADAVEPGLLTTFANLGGMGVLAGVLFYLHLLTLRESARERDAARLEREAMRTAMERNNAVTEAIADRLKVPPSARTP